MLDDLLRESSVADALIEEGIEKGMQQGMRATILRVLEGRFGTVDAALAEAIQHADEAALDDLSLHAGTDSLEHLRARLRLS